jgi:hypothetical protein
MTNKPSTLSLNEEDDFGFTIVDETELLKNTVSEYDLRLEELTDKLQLMYDAILPLLKNLSKNPDQEIIKWPDRKVKILEFKKRLESIGGIDIKVKSL